MQIVFCVSYILLNTRNAVAMSEHIPGLALILFLDFVSITTSHENLVLHRYIVAKIRTQNRGFPLFR